MNKTEKLPKVSHSAFDTRTLVVLMAVAVLLYIMKSFLLPLMMGGLIAILIFPMVVIFEKKLKCSRSLASVLVTLITALLVIFPFSLMIGVGVQNSLKLFRSLKDKIDLSGGWSNFDVLQFDWAQKLLSKFPFEKEEVLSTMTDLSKGLVEKSATLFSSIVSELPSLTLGVVFTVLSLYFFLNDAERVEKTVRQVSVFKDRETDRLISTFSKMARSVMVASLGSGLIQAVIYSVAYWIAEFGFGRGGASGGFLFVCVFVASFIPVIGSAPITFGLAIYEIFQSGYPVGVTLLIGATLVSVSDNITRPAILRGAADLHPLLGLVSALGGLEAFGFVGMFIGPILAAMVRVAVQILIESRH